MSDQNKNVQSAPEKHINYVRLLVVNIQDELIAIPVKNVIEVDIMPEYTKIPNLPKVILGVCNLRGDVVSLIDGRMFFGAKESRFTESTRVDFVTNNKIVTGLIVDGYSEIVDLKEEKIMPIGSESKGLINEVSYGIFSKGSSIVRVLSLEKFFRTNIILHYQ